MAGVRVLGFLAIWLLLSGCAREAGPEEVALEYGRALYARDLARAYRFISSQDRRLKDEQTFHRERGEANGFALEVARQLASFISATPLEKTIGGIRAAYLFLRDQGYRNLTVMEDGFPGWVNHGYPVER